MIHTMVENKIKVLYVESTLESSGPTTQLLGLIKNLDKIKFEPIVLTLSSEPSFSAKELFIQLGVKVDSLNLSRFQFLIYGKYLLKKKIEKYKPGIIHSAGIRADLAITQLKLKYLHCITVHNYVFDDYICNYGGIIGRIAACFGISTIRKCKYAICCSKSLKEKYDKVLYKKLYTIQNGVDTDSFNPVSDEDQKRKLRLVLGIPQDKIVFLVVGSLIKRKDPVCVINAFKQANVGKESVLILLGDGELYEECRKQSDNSIILKGKINNVKDYLKAADVYISASRSEGLPYSVLEAGSSGLDLILSNIPQHMEIFEKDFKLMTSFETGNVSNLALIIQEKVNKGTLLNNDGTTKLIRSNFTDKLMSKNYEKIYYEMLDMK